MAYPLVTALVVLPTASSASVLARTSGGRSDISAMPPALSVIGPYVSIATIMPVIDSIATAATAMPYSPDSMNAAKIANARMMVGTKVEFMPTARPLMMLVALPVSLALAMRRTGG